MVLSVGSPSVLLAHSYYLHHDSKQVAKMRPYPPLATLLAAAVARARGLPVALFDAMLAGGVGDFTARLSGTRPAVVGLLEDNFNFLTKMCTVRMREAACEMIRAARAHGCRVAVNGSDALDRPETYLDAGADAIITGDAEQAFAELAQRWLASPDAALDDVPGLIVRDGQAGLRRTAPRPFLDDLDTLPVPAWDLVDVERYRAAWRGAHGRFSWNVVTSRGCPYRCNWCAKPVFGTRYAQRGPDQVADELAQLKAAVDPDHVWFADDIFGLTARWILQFAEACERRGVRIPFAMQSRVNLMRPPVVAALARAGAEEVWLGVESGAQHILDAMDKGTTIAQVRAATRALRAHGIRSGWFIQLGYLDEAWDDVLRTRDLVRAEQPDEIGVSVAYPLPGTGFYERVHAQLGPKRHWQDSGELAMLFRGTYTTPFYRAVRDLLHAEVRAGAPGRAALDRQWTALEAREAENRSERAYAPVTP